MAAALLLWQTTAGAQITVDPVGVNVRHTGPTTVFLTFRGLSPTQQAAEGTWCAELNPDNSCVPTTIFGRLPQRSELSRRSGAQNFTDIMTIPASVNRRGFQAAQRGTAPNFFYVRRFVDTAGGPDEFVPVTCRLASGGARSPLALLEVRLRFADDRPVVSVTRGEAPPAFEAEILYTGTGRLKGRWEVVLPGDTPPTSEDLLTEATLPVEERGRQKRYTLVERFDEFLPPSRRPFVLRGPAPAKLPRGADGLHLILLRVEASDDRESRSNAGIGVVSAGGVAGFPLPVLRYYVGEELADPSRAPEMLLLLAPAPEAVVGAGRPVVFRWRRAREAELYRLEVESEEHTPVLSAALGRDVSSYTAPPWLRDHAGALLRWRVQAFARSGRATAESAWSEFRIEGPGAAEDGKSSERLE